jgi:proline dehydrogenase
MTLFDRAIAGSLQFVPRAIVRKVANRYIAGEAVQDAIRVAEGLNKLRARATMDVLGEDVHGVEDARRAAREYGELLEEIYRTGIDSNVSIKLTQFGLKIDRKLCFDLVEGLVKRAAKLNNFVRIDMEDSSCTTDTLEIYRELRKDHSNLGVVIQAYLRRTMADVESLESIRPNYRLCKGVYVEPHEIAYREMRLINENYVRILEQLFRNGSYVGIATHDEFIAREALRLIKDLNVPKSSYEFQMLLGVGEDLRRQLLSAGHHLRVYIPFGRDWYKYSVRRLRENPRLAGYVLKAMFK